MRLWGGRNDLVFVCFCINFDEGIFEMTKKPHKHAELIKAWADGAEIEYRDGQKNPWRSMPVHGDWEDFFEYRIKPEPKPDVVEYRYLIRLAEGLKPEDANLKIVFDGETGKLKSAEVLK